MFACFHFTLLVHMQKIEFLKYLFICLCSRTTSQQDQENESNPELDNIYAKIKELERSIVSLGICKLNLRAKYKQTNSCRFFTGEV